jgi:hypothetical protein
MTPFVFQNGFVANRIARHEQQGYPGAEIRVAQIRRGRAVEFMVEKEEAGTKTYWVSHADGFVSLPEKEQ